MSLLSTLLLPNSLPSSLDLLLRSTLLLPPTLTLPSLGHIVNLVLPEVFNIKVSDITIQLNL